MKKFFLLSLLVSFFLACKGNIENNGVPNVPNTRISQEELEKLKEPTENVVTLKDEFSRTEYVLQNVINPNSNSKYILRFDKETNKIYFILHDGQDVLKRDFLKFICLREIDNDTIKFDFTPFEVYAKKYDINIFLDEVYNIYKTCIEELEKKTNRTLKEEEVLKDAREKLVYFSSVEELKKIDPKLKVYQQIKVKLVRSAEVFKELNPVGMISSDKSTITFPKFFFLDFVDNNDCKAPKIFENIVFKKR